MRKAGFSFALDDVVAASANVEALLPHVQVIKVDLCGVPADQLAQLSTRFRAAGKKLLAEKVENAAQYEQCLQLGFDYFQGFHFARPLVLQGKRLSPSQLAVQQVLALMHEHADEAKLEQTIKHDPSVGLTLVRLASRLRPDMQPGIDSIGHALRQVEQQDLRRWLQILLYAEPAVQGEGTAPLLALAATRGRLLELLARHLRPQDGMAGEVAFTVGMLSLADALFGQPMEQVLEQLAVSEEVRKALLRREGWYGQLLALAEQIEREDVDGQGAACAMESLGLTNGDFYRLQLQAFEWGDTIAANAVARE
jgi:EAL and modified HD-GYP domain-containing signal transduction protein